MRDSYANINTIVIVGAWNISIFTQEWVRNNILRGEDYPEVNVSYPLNMMHSLRFSTNKFEFCIGNNRFMFTLKEKSDQAEKDMLMAVSSICSKLPYTPVTALGVNFIFETESSVPVLNTLRDTESIVRSIGLDQDSVQITRSFKRNETETLNFKISQISGGNVKYDINNDYKVRDIREILDVLNGDDNIISTKRNEALTLLRTVYNEELDN